MSLCLSESCLPSCWIVGFDGGLHVINAELRKNKQVYVLSVAWVYSRLSCAEAAVNVAIILQQLRKTKQKDKSPFFSELELVK